MYRDMCIRRVHKTSSYACLRFTLERERQTITVSSLSVMTAIKKNKSEQRERKRWLCNFESGGRMASPRSWPLDRTWGRCGSETAGIWKQPASQQRKGQVQVQVQRCLSLAASFSLSPAPTKAVSKAMLSWRTEMPRAHRTGRGGKSWCWGCGWERRGGVTTAFSCSSPFKLSSFERADVSLALNLL